MLHVHTRTSQKPLMIVYLKEYEGKEEERKPNVTFFLRQLLDAIIYRAKEGGEIHIEKGEETIPTLQSRRWKGKESNKACEIPLFVEHAHM